MRRILAEAAASARSGPAASILTILIIAGMVLTVMMTTGRTVAAEQQVLGSIDDAGTRTIQIRAEDTAGITSDVLDRLRHIDGIEWAAAFSSAIDATNALVPDGTRVPVRYLYTDQLDRLGITDVPVLGATAYASQTALDQFGLPDIGGAITLTTGATATIGNRISVPDYLQTFEPVTLIPAPTAAAPVTVNVILVIAKTPELVAPLSDAVVSVLAATDPTKVSVQTSETLANLRALIQSQLGSSSRALVLGLIVITALLVAVILYGLVIMRRKDFGRRRALGATRGYIITLLVVQTTLLALLGIGVGLLAATALALGLDDPLPGISFTVAVSVLALVAAVLAALAPAVAASRREPIRELRIP
ncbi:ABC transporter permease [Microbacterium flavum]|uniref:ABC transporter permease n=1 Tax=Microbacterium flavum TaxID=415216 RepID=UPI0024ACB7A4|nr:FtsX-like permease family protein [Microbacterium flavum]